MGAFVDRDFTVFCQDNSGTGTIWIETVTVHCPEDDPFPEHEIHMTATSECAMAWERNDPENIHLMGVADPNIDILYWDDSHVLE